ncbi:MAG: ribonuclease P protein component [Candidatus Margulisbacteria bacterium]|nr:ribonuclease P protein component [Candidatus Margulisiibacteriota bacterium]
MLRKEERLAKQKDIQLVIRQQQLKFCSPFFNLIARENGLSNSRIAIAVSKKVGKAVARNRLRRRLRAIYKNKIKNQIHAPVDIMVYPKNEALNADNETIENWLKKGLRIKR